MGQAYAGASHTPTFRLLSWSGVGAGHHVQPASHSPATDAPAPEEVLDSVRVQPPILLVANNGDLNPEPEKVQVLEELAGGRPLAIARFGQNRPRPQQLPP